MTMLSQSQSNDGDDEGEDETALGWLTKHSQSTIHTYTTVLHTVTYIFHSQYVHIYKQYKKQIKAYIHKNIPYHTIPYIYAFQP
jgi:hypothetical protein